MEKIQLFPFFAIILVIDTLHLFLCISDLLINLLIRELGQQDGIEKAIISRVDKSNTVTLSRVGVYCTESMVMTSVHCYQICSYPRLFLLYYQALPCLHNLSTHQSAAISKPEMSATILNDSDGKETLFITQQVR